MKRVFLPILVVVASIVFSGCGGGSSTSGTGSEGAKLAKATYENAQKVEEALFSKAYSDNGYRAREIGNSSSVKANPLVFNLAKGYIKLNSVNSSVRQRTLSNVCQSGSVDEDVISETATSKTIIYRYNNCSNGVKVVNGSVTLKLSDKSGDNYNRESIIFGDNYSVNYSNGKSLKIDNGGVIDITITNYISDNNFEFVLDTTMKITEDGYSYGYDGMELHYTIFAQDTYWYQTTGVIYINNYSEFVLYDNSYNMAESEYKLDSNGYPITGEARYKMDGGVLRVVANNGAIDLDIIQ